MQKFKFIIHKIALYQSINIFNKKIKNSIINLLRSITN